MKYFIFSDVHGFYNELMQALEVAGYDRNNPNHCVISLGDLLDRGPDDVKCIEFVNSLNNKILIGGNHEDLLVQALCKREFSVHDLHNYTIDTCYQVYNTATNSNTQLFDVSDKEICETVLSYEPLNTYLDSLKDYAEIKDNIFVHGWIPLTNSGKYKADWRKAPTSCWKRAKWYNGMSLWYQGIREEGKTIYCGHWHTSWGHANLHNDGVEFLQKIETFYIDPDTGKTEPHINNNPFKDKGIVALDACTVISHKVNVEVIEI